MNKHLAIVAVCCGIAIVAGCKNGGKRSEDTVPPRADIAPIVSEEEMKSYLASCREVDFDEVLRHPKQFTGKDVWVHGKVLQVDFPDPKAKNHRGTLWVLGGGKGDEWRITYDDENTSFLDGNVLDDDYVTVCGKIEKIDHGVDSKGIGWNAPVILARIITEKSFEEFAGVADKDEDDDNGATEVDGGDED